MSRVRLNNAEHAYIVAYDISDQKRWRKVFQAMKGYGRRLQLSVWQCRLDGARRIEMAMALEGLIDRSEDHVVILDLGPAEDVTLNIESFGQRFEPIERTARIL